MRWVLILSGLLLSASTVAQKKGILTDSVAVRDFKHESFAIYLPKSYDPDVLSSIVFIFDPAARGTVGVKPFIEAAEKYNYILVCSNNSRNGPYAPNLDLANRLFAHVFSHFNISEDRVYTAGFSGGSRLATTIAVLTNAIQGVIGCGAGFSRNSGHIPSIGNTFSYVGLVGDRDMNFQEMIKAAEWFNSMNIENEILIYEDNHRWPRPEQLLRAFGWLELQAYKRGIKPTALPVVRQIYADEYQYAGALVTSGKIFSGVREYERLIRNFKPYFELDSLAGKIRALKKSKPYKLAIKDFNQVAQLEDTLSSRYLRKYNKEVNLGRSEDGFKWWRKQLKKLDKTYVNSESAHFQKMGERLRYQLYALGIESFEGYVRQKNKDKAIYTARFLDIQGHYNAFVHYRLAAGFARLQLRERSLYHIEASLKNGWDHLEAFISAPAFKDLRSDKDLENLLEKYQQ